MTWFKVDDGLALHAKTVAAGNAAMGLWVRAGAWSAQQLTDGYVPTAIARTLGTAGEARALVAAGLWAAEEGGYRFWQWQQRNPSRSDVEAERIAAKERMRSRRVRPNIAARSPEVPANAPSKPDECSVAPSRPVPTIQTTAPTVLPAPTPTQRSKRITDAYAALEPMCRWPAVNGIVLKALAAGRWSDSEICDGLLRLAKEGRGVTVESLRVELDGLPASRAGPSTTDAKVAATLRMAEAMGRREVER